MRRFLQLLLHLTLGTMVTVLLCWTLALIVPAEYINDSTRFNASGSGVVRRAQTSQCAVATRLFTESFADESVRYVSGGVSLPREPLPKWSVGSQLDGVPLGRRRYDQEHAFGWPFLAMTSHWSLEEEMFFFGSRFGYPPLELQDGIEIPESWSLWVMQRTPSKRGFISDLDDDDMALPTRVIPLGFLTDSLLFAVILWFLTSVFRYMRRKRRRRRGTCVGCGYDLRGGHTRCPECGRALSKPAPA